MPWESCAIEGCGRPGTVACFRCGARVCEQHLITDYRHLPGGQRPYCLACDAERRAVYQQVRTQGRRAILWSGGGATLGALAGAGIGQFASPDGFVHTVTTDVGFILGLAVALFLALATGSSVRVRY